MAVLASGVGVLKSVFGIKVSRTTAALPATTQAPIFTVANGRVLITGIIGEVTTIIQAQACTLKITANPTTGSDVDICAATDLNALEVGGKISAVAGPVAAPFGIALVKSLAGASPYGFGTHGLVAAIGTLDIVTSATNTGSIKWDITYIPLDTGAVLTAA